MSNALSPGYLKRLKCISHQNKQLFEVIVSQEDEALAAFRDLIHALYCLDDEAIGSIKRVIVTPAVNIHLLVFSSLVVSVS